MNEPISEVIRELPARVGVGAVLREVSGVIMADIVLLAAFRRDARDFIRGVVRAVFVRSAVRPVRLRDDARPVAEVIEGIPLLLAGRVRDVRLTLVQCPALEVDETMERVVRVKLILVAVLRPQVFLVFGAGHIIVSVSQFDHVGAPRDLVMSHPEYSTPRIVPVKVVLVSERQFHHAGAAVVSDAAVLDVEALVGVIGDGVPALRDGGQPMQGVMREADGAAVGELERGANAVGGDGARGGSGGGAVEVLLLLDGLVGAGVAPVIDVLDLREVIVGIFAVGLAVNKALPTLGGALD